MFSFPALSAGDNEIAFTGKVQLNESMCDKIVRILELLTRVIIVMIVLRGEHLRLFSQNNHLHL